MLTLVLKHLSSEESSSRAMNIMNAKLLVFINQVKVITFMKFSNSHCSTFKLRKLLSLGISKRKWNSNVDNIILATCDWIRCPLWILSKSKFVVYFNKVQELLNIKQFFVSWGRHIKTHICIPSTNLHILTIAIIKTTQAARFKKETGLNLPK